MKLETPHNIFEQMLDQARAEAPIEACGILAGTDNAVKKLYRMTNAESRSDRYMIDPKEQFAVVSHVFDLRGVACPLNFVKAKTELEKIPVGHTLAVLLDQGESVRNVPESFAQQGQEVLEIEDHGDHSCVRVRREK